jgi:hypothetical protein
MFALFLGAVALLAQPPPPVAPSWQTAYERSGYVETGSYDEAVAYCRRLAAASPQARVITFGVSPQGRPLIALMMSREGAFTPEAARRSRKALVILNNGIHSGEIEGKDADLLMARDILIAKSQERLLDNVNLLLIPIFSVDAHERSSPYNRINQNGPRMMGWRATAVNLNLNRDFMKADAEEMQAMLRLLHAWKPDFLFDNHTTDGADWQYAMQLAMPLAQTQAAPVLEWTQGMLASVLPQVERDGFLNAPYFDGVDYSHLDRGLSVSDFTARFSTGYLAAMNRPNMLVETHMLKPYRQRVEATYSINRRVIEYIDAHAAELKAANRAADEAETRLKPGDAMALEVQTTAETRPFTFRGWQYQPYRSAISGALTPAWTHEPTNTETTIRDRFAPTLTVPAPAAYALPPQWKEVIMRLELHGLHLIRLKRPMTGSFETYRFEDVAFPREPFEGRFQPRYKAVKITEERTLPAGAVIVPVAQVGAKLAMQLLEPDAPDSLAHWGLFNTVFEQKEYFESYAMEPIARKMQEADPKLKAEFEERLKDPKFAANPRARLQFWFERSPYYDAALNKYPVVRLTAEQWQSAQSER